MRRRLSSRASRTDGEGANCARQRQSVPRVSAGPFRGYFEVQAEGYDPVLFYEVRAPVSPTYITVPLVPPSYYAAAYDSSGLKDDAADGMIVVHAADCEDNALSGVSLRLAPASAEVVTWYGMGVDTVRSNSPDGIGGFTSIEPGRYEVTVLGPGAGEADVIARAAVWVRGGVRTMLWTRPLASTDQ